jgi:hypothetical protein
MLDALRLITVAIVPGYTFIKYDYKSDYTAPFLSDRMLYTRILFFGIGFTFLSILISPELLSIYKENYPNIIAHFKETHSSNFELLRQVFIAVVATCISWTTAKARSLFTLKFNEDFHVEFLLEHGTQLQIFSIGSIINDVSNSEHDLYLEVRLKNDKVYIGLPSDFPEPIKPNHVEYFYLLPLYSGYRKSPDHSLELTTHYIDHYEEIIQTDNLESDEEIDSLLDNFAVAICADEIVTVRKFDIGLYFEKYKKENKAN